MQGRQASDKIQESNIAGSDEMKKKKKKRRKKKVKKKKKRMQVPEDGGKWSMLMDRAICSVSLSSLCLFARREDSFARKSYNLASRAKLSSCLSGTISPKGDRAVHCASPAGVRAAFNRAE